MPTDEDLMTIRQKLQETESERDILQGELNFHRKRDPLLVEFIRKYSYHSTNCRYPQLSCNCGYSRARARCDV